MGVPKLRAGAVRITVAKSETTEPGAHQKLCGGNRGPREGVLRGREVSSDVQFVSCLPMVRGVQGCNDIRFASSEP